MLRLSNITIEYAKVLFKDLSFTLGNKEKVGLVGFNGSGKSTLLKIIAGIEPPDKGSVTIVAEKIGYLPQVFDLTAEGKHTYVGEYLEELMSAGGFNTWELDKVLAKLEFGELDEFQELKALSPGQQMKLYLAQLILNDCSILLLDEPTNHLDLEGILWFEKFIQQFKGICIIISHDREFLNSSVNQIFELEQRKLNIYQGNYDDYLVEKQARLEKFATQYHLQEVRRKKFEDMITQIRNQSSGGGQGRRLQSAKTRLQREVLADELKIERAVKLKDFEIAGHLHDRKRVLELKGVEFAYQDSKRILSGINLDIYGSERLWLQGANGQGKSTLLKLITGELRDYSGTINWGENLRWKYFAQDQTDLELAESVQEYFTRESGVVWDRSYGVLEKFAFSKELRDQSVRSLSPGQKARLRFAIFAQKEYQCLILDEPTNHIDIETKEVIEESLRSFKGAIILVSHDRYFAEQLAPGRVLKIQDGEIREV